MSQAVDDLERQLMRAVRARRSSATPWLRRGHRRTWALVVAAMLVISGGALAASRLADGKSLTTQGDEMAVHAVTQTAHLPACKRISPVNTRLAMTQGTPVTEITDVLPSLKTPASSVEQDGTLKALARARVKGVLFASTLKTVAVSQHLKLVVAVGPREESVADPEVCARAQLARAEELASNRRAGVLRRARWRLAQDRETAPGVQTLYIYEVPVPLPRGVLAGGGTGIPVWKGRPLKAGIPLVGGGPDGSRLFLGIAARDAAHIRLQTDDTAAMRGLPRVVPVVEGFFAVTVPRGIGRFSMLELARDGAVLRPVDLHQ